MIVLDCSAALCRILPNQMTIAAQAFFSVAPPPEFIAPAFEIRNVLLRSERQPLAWLFTI